MEEGVKLIADCSLPLGHPDAVVEAPLTPEEQAEVAGMAAAESKNQANRAFALADDAERIAVIAERAAEDPAYAALADIVLSGKGI